MISAVYRKLVETLKVKYGTDRIGIDFRLPAETISMGVDIAVPCGLIIQVLVSNALKYAFPEGWKGSPAVWISTKQSGEITD